MDLTGVTASITGAITDVTALGLACLSVYTKASTTYHPSITYANAINHPISYISQTPIR